MTIDKKKFQEMAELEQSIKTHQMMHENAMRQLQNVKETMIALNEFKKLKGDEEILLPLTTGILAKAQIKEKKLYMNVGAGVVKEKTVDECLNALKEQEMEVTNFLAKIEQEFETLTKKVEDYKDV